MQTKEPAIPLLTTVYVALVILLGISIVLSRFHLGTWSMPAALLIATLKALLILLVFMRVGYGHGLIWLMAGAGFVWLGILLVLSFSDYLTR